MTTKSNRLRIFSIRDKVNVIGRINIYFSAL